MEKDTLIVGRKPVLDAIQSATRLEKIWIDKDIRGDFEKEIRREARLSNTPLQYVPKQKLSALSSNANHQGIVAQLAIVEYYTIDELLPLLYEQGRVPRILVLDGIEDVRNIGALARSAVWFDFDAIVIASKKSALLNSFAYKASAGAIKDIHLCREASLAKALEYMKASGLKLIAAEAGNDTSKELPGPHEPMALILGSEGKGLNPGIHKLADSLYSIPGSGRVESLNVSVAGALIMHEIFNKK